MDDMITIRTRISTKEMEAYLRRKLMQHAAEKETVPNIVLHQLIQLIDEDEEDYEYPCVASIDACALVDNEHGCEDTEFNNNANNTVVHLRSYANDVLSRFAYSGEFMRDIHYRQGEWPFEYLLSVADNLIDLQFGGGAPKNGCKNFDEMCRESFSHIPTAILDYLTSIYFPKLEEWSGKKIVTLLIDPRTILRGIIKEAIFKGSTKYSFALNINNVTKSCSNDEINYVHDLEFRIFSFSGERPDVSIESISSLLQEFLSSIPM